MSEIIYAIKVTDLAYSGLKIGDIDSWSYRVWLFKNRIFLSTLC